MKKIAILTASLLALVSLVGCSNQDVQKTTIEEPTMTIHRLADGTDTSNHEYIDVTVTITPSYAYSNLSAKILFEDGSDASSALTATIADSTPGNYIVRITKLTAFSQQATCTISDTLSGLSTSFTIDYTQKLDSFSVVSGSTNSALTSSGYWWNDFRSQRITPVLETTYTVSSTVSDIYCSSFSYSSTLLNSITGTKFQAAEQSGVALDGIVATLDAMITEWFGFSDKAYSQEEQEMADWSTIAVNHLSTMSDVDSYNLIHYLLNSDQSFSFNANLKLNLSYKLTNTYDTSTHNYDLAAKSYAFKLDTALIQTAFAASNLQNSGSIYF